MSKLTTRWLIVLAVSCACIVGGTSSAQFTGNGVDVALKCRKQGNEASLDITFRNVGTADTAVVLGKILGNGAKYLADNLELEVRTRSDFTRYRYGDPRVPGIAGRVDTWVVTLPVASEYTMSRPDSHFWSGAARLTELALPFAARIAFTAPPISRAYPIVAMKVYEGSLSSNWLEIPTDCTRE